MPNDAKQLIKSFPQEEEMEARGFPQEEEMEARVKRGKVEKEGERRRPIKRGPEWDECAAEPNGKP